MNRSFIEDILTTVKDIRRLMVSKEWGTLPEEDRAISEAILSASLTYLNAKGIVE